MTVQTLANASADAMPFPDGHFHCIATSPPYKGLRAYAGNAPRSWPDGAYAPVLGAPACMVVPEWTGNFGSEETVSMYVWHTLLVLRECKRVLRDDGILWYNIGDSYSSGSRKTWADYDAKRPHLSELSMGVVTVKQGQDGQLLGIPSLVQHAAQADGWLVRNDLIWHKKSCMPESVSGTRWRRPKCQCVTYPDERRADRDLEGKPRLGGDVGSDNNPSGLADPACALCHGTGYSGEFRLRRGAWRHTRAQETILMLTKSNRYWSDGEAVREPVKEVSLQRVKYPFHTSAHVNERKVNSRSDGDMTQFVNPFGRNPRSVLTPVRKNYHGKHYAAYPPALVRPLILAAAPRQCCAQCRAGYAPVVQPVARQAGLAAYTSKFKQGETGLGQQGFIRADTIANERAESRTIAAAISPDDPAAQRAYVAAVQNSGRPKPPVLEYRPTCACNAGEPVAGRVLDPFVGSGTTLLVCKELGLHGVGLDLSFEYLHAQAAPRIAQYDPLAPKPKQAKPKSVPTQQGILL